MKKIRQIIYNWVDRKFLGGCSSYNSLATRKSCRSKKQAREAFVRYNIPHAKGTIFYNPLAALNFVRKNGFPVVIKPNVSGFSRGSYFPITNYAELLKAAFLVKIWWPSSVIEQYLDGKNYRVVVIKDEIMSVIRRYPPFVIGDNKSTISELIDRENRIREQMGLYPVMHAIAKGDGVARFLKTKGFLLSSVPRQGEMIALHNKIALAPGGVVETVDKTTIHPQNRELFLRILPIFTANILGIDAIFERGLEVPYLEQKVIFLEVNSRPYLKMHDFPRYGEKEDFSSYYGALESLDIGEKDLF